MFAGGYFTYGGFGHPSQPLLAKPSFIDEPSEKENIKPNRPDRAISKLKIDSLAFKHSFVAAEERVERLADPQQVEVYVGQIFEYLLDREPAGCPSHTFISDQRELTDKMREILVDWLVDVAVKLKLRTETLFLAVNYMDRFLSTSPVSRRRFQLLGVTCLFMASKYEEIYPPHTDEFVKLADGSISKSELTATEAEVINGLAFELSHSTALRFFTHFAQTMGFTSKASFLGRYLCELSLTDSKMARFRNSQVGAAAAYLTNRVLRKSAEWPSEMAALTRLSLSEVRQCAKELYILLLKSGKQSVTTSLGGEGALNAVKRKYATEKYMRVSQIAIEHRF